MRLLDIHLEQIQAIPVRERQHRLEGLQQRRRRQQLFQFSMTSRLLANLRPSLSFMAPTPWVPTGSRFSLSPHV